MKKFRGTCRMYRLLYGYSSYFQPLGLSDVFKKPATLDAFDRQSFEPCVFDFVFISEWTLIIARRSKSSIMKVGDNVGTIPLEGRRVCP